MSGFLVAFFSAVGGTAVGCLLTWILANRSERNRARREILVRVAQAFQDYRVAYAQWYVEYLSPEARKTGGHWVKAPTGKPDVTYLSLMRRVDEGGGQFRVLKGALYAHFPQGLIDPLCAHIHDVLELSSYAIQADCHHVDQVAEKACDLIPDLIKRYL